MGSACSDTVKRPTAITSIKRFSSFEEISDTSSTVSFYSAGNQNVDFELKKKNELRNVSSYWNTAPVKHYGHTKRLKTRYIDRKIVTLTEQGSRQCCTVSKLKITQRRSYEQIGFQKKGDGFECTLDDSERDGTPGVSPTYSDTISSDVCPISRFGNMCSGEVKSKTSVGSRSPLSVAKVLKANHPGTEINQEKPTNNDSVFSLENATNLIYSESGPLGESTSSQDLLTN